MEVEKHHIQFKHPGTIYIAGPTGSGKTELVRNIFENHADTFYGLNKEIINIIYCYGKWNESFNTPQQHVNYTYYQGLPNDEEELLHFDVVIIDDLMVEIGKNNMVLNLFTNGSHHNHQTIVIITQNLFYKGVIIRDLSLNSHYVIPFKNPRDQQQIRRLGLQAFPGNLKFFMSAYEQATKEKHGYLVCDFKQETPDEFRLRTDIIPLKEFNNTMRVTIFLPK